MTIGQVPIFLQTILRLNPDWLTLKGKKEIQLLAKAFETTVNLIHTECGNCTHFVRDSNDEYYCDIYAENYDANFDEQGHCLKMKRKEDKNNES